MILTELKMSPEEKFKIFLNGFVDNCGISYGERSVYYDFASLLLKEITTKEEFRDIDDYTSKYRPDWDSFKDYDAGMQAEPTITVALGMIWAEHIQETDLPIFYQTLDKYIESTVTNLEIDRVLEEIKSSCYFE